MQKIAILTINDDYNYGNRLQNYAFQKFANNQGIKTYTIENKKGNYGINVYKQCFKDIIKKVVKHDIQTKKYFKFKQFNKNITYSKYKIDKQHIPTKLKEKYDAFFVGSDQVWNPNFGRMSDIDFLTFVPENKRNSMAASFGVSNIKPEMKQYYTDRLSKFNNISVREDTGKKIVEELTGRTDVEVLVDPTMLVTPEEWDKVSKKPEQLNFDKYILCYFLGELSEQRKKEIERVAKENDCKIINILDKKNPFYETGPSEFLYLEKNAFLICTDSFHSSVFAILYNRPFIVFDREDSLVKMNSRLDTLLKKFELEDRWYEGEIKEEQLKTDYTKAYEILEKEREKSMKFLKKALDIK